MFLVPANCPLKQHWEIWQWRILCLHPLADIWFSSKNWSLHIADFFCRLANCGCPANFELAGKGKKEKTHFWPEIIVFNHLPKVDSEIYIDIPIYNIYLNQAAGWCVHLICLWCCGVSSWGSVREGPPAGTNLLVTDHHRYYIITT